MTQRGSVAALALSVLVLAASAPALADTVLLDNGDRITGVFVQKQGDSLEFQPDYGDVTLTIPWNQVASLATDEPIRVLLGDGTEVVGRAVEASPGSLRMIPEDLDDPVTFRIASIQAVSGPDTPPRDSVRTSGNISVGGSLTRGNTRTESAFGAADFTARTNVNRIRFSAEANRAKDGEELSRDNAAGSLRYDHFLSERTYINTSVNLSRDRFRDLRLRTSAGVGLGYQFFDNAQRSLSVELGASYVNSNYYTADNEANPAARWALDYQERLFGGVRLFHAQEGFQSMDSSDELQVTTRTGVRFPLLAGISGTLQANIDYNKTPPAGNKTTDSAYLLTAGYSW